MILLVSYKCVREREFIIFISILLLFIILLLLIFFWFILFSRKKTESYCNNTHKNIYTYICYFKYLIGLLTKDIR